MKYFYCLFIALSFAKTFGQHSNVKYITTPEIKKFISNIDYPIELNSGGVFYSIPLFQIPVDNVGIKLNLNYTSRGVKVGDTSGEFGQDWTLTIPKVSREVRGIPDELENGYLNPPNGFKIEDLYNRLKSGRSFIIDSLGKKSNDEDIFYKAYNRELDLQPDKFYFELNGKNGYFMFDDQTNKIITYPFTDLKIIPSLPHSILIIDSDGTEYHFGGKDNVANEINEIEEQDYVSTWNLVQIKKKNKSIFLNYTNKLNIFKTFINEKSVLYGSPEFLQKKDEKVYKMNRIRKPYLNQIVADNLSVLFTYLPSDFVEGGRKINEIKIRRGNEDLTYSFEFISYLSEIEHDASSKTKRIFLNKVFKISDKVKDFYSFEYNNPQCLPSRLSPKIDLW